MDWVNPTDNCCLKAEAEIARLKSEMDAEKVRVEAEKAGLEARLQVEVEARLKAEEEARLKAEEEARLKAEAEARSRVGRDGSRGEDEALLRAAGVLSLTLSHSLTHSVLSLPLSIPHSWCICAFCVFSKLCNISSSLLSRLLLLSLYSRASP